MANQQQRVGFVLLTLKFWQEDGQWLGECLELGTATFGATLEEVRAGLSDAVLLHLNELEDSGERERFFREEGITLYTDEAPRQIPPRAMPPDPDALFSYSTMPVTAGPADEQPAPSHHRAPTDPPAPARWLGTPPAQAGKPRCVTQADSRDGRKRTVIVPDTRRSLPRGTLMAILAAKQTRLGRQGLLGLMEQHGLR